MAIDVSNLSCDCPPGCDKKNCGCDICIDQRELEVIKRMGEML